MKILDIDPWLEPFADDLKLRMERYESEKRVLLKNKKSSLILPTDIITLVSINFRMLGLQRMGTGRRGFVFNG